jgi:hypothetical protein
MHITHMALEVNVNMCTRQVEHMLPQSLKVQIGLCINLTKNNCSVWSAADRDRTFDKLKHYE